MDQEFGPWMGALGWLLSVAVLACFGAFHLARRPKARSPSAPSMVSASASVESLRSASPLQVRLVQSSMDVDQFCSMLLRQAPGAMVFRDPDAFAYPCYVAAIPDAGLSFDVRPIAFDPRSELAGLEARILDLASQNMPASGSQERPKNRRL